APGYGYARRAKSTKDEFIVMIENILLNHPKIVSVLLLIDFKVGPTEDDLDIYNFLLSLNLKIIVIATKNDKIAKTRRPKHEKEIKNKLLNPPYFYAISNTEKNNIENIKNEILERINNYESN
ncbi:MAG TPA: YihA family ribosome biogenesis GTP-binding protein, partial [Acholeplasmataceae bacterium]|nr:YihA family ribosome biogenesis GTP-binding protein [Acholeplasmataceae bacterium]